MVLLSFITTATVLRHSHEFVGRHSNHPLDVVHLQYKQYIDVLKNSCFDSSNKYFSKTFWKKTKSYFSNTRLFPKNRFCQATTNWSPPNINWSHYCKLYLSTAEHVGERILQIAQRLAKRWKNVMPCFLTHRVAGAAGDSCHGGDSVMWHRQRNIRIRGRGSVCTSPTKCKSVTA